jgi:HAE1 family hydrophobic/amphiphilic exporter-1
MTITEIAIKRPTLVVVLFSFLTVLGIFGFLQLKYDLLPKMSAPVVTVTTIYPGSSPSEVENTVSRIIEDAVTGIDKIVTVRTTSSEGRSFVYIEFEQSVDINIAIQDAQRKVNEVSDRLPKDAKKPVISKISFDEIPVLRMSVKSNMPTSDFFQFIKDKIQPRIAKTSGVGMVNLTGGEEREIQINIDLEKLKSVGLSLNMITNTIKAANMDFPTGSIKEENSQYVVRIAGKFDDVNQMSELIVGRSKQGGDIKLKDIAEIKDGIKEITNYNRLNGVPSIGMLVQKQSDANSVDVSKLVRKEIALIIKDYKEYNVQFEIAQDASTFTLDSAKGVGEDLLLAILLVAIVMLVFLHNFQNSFIVLVAIPASLVSTLFAMWAFDFSLNLMTLLGMSLVIGILVDDSIVVLENIYRHLEMGDNSFDAAVKGRNEIGFAAISITLVDVVVFVPLALVSGMIGNMLREYALVIVFSTLMSLIVSFTITPSLASRLTKLQHLTKGTLMGRFGLAFENFFDRITEYYSRTLRWSLNNGGKVVLMISALMIATFALIGGGFIGAEFMPVVDRGELIVTIELEPGATIEKTNQITLQIEKMLKDFKEVRKVLTNTGASSEGFIGVFMSNAAEFNVTLSGKNERKFATDEIGQQIKYKIQEIPGVKVRVAPVSIMGTANRSPIQILLTGSNHEDLITASQKVLNAAKEVKGTTDQRLSSEEGKPELSVIVDRVQLSKLGLTIMDVGQNLRTALTGDDDSKFREGTNEFAIRVRLDRFDRSNIENVSNMSFINNKGQSIFLKQFANVIQTTGPTKLERENRISSITVFSGLFGRTSREVATDIESKIKYTGFLPKGVSYEFIGEQKTMKDSFASLFWALMAGILFVYMIMVALYNSYVYPFVVLFSIPVAIIGAILALALTMKSINIYSILGLIMLIGLVAKNAILLVDRANQMKAERGMNYFDALMEAGKTRLRPIVMTTFAMVMGMSPIAMSSSAGSEAKSGLAVVLIGGLLSSMFLTLVLVPVVYQKVDKIKENMARKKAKKLAMKGIV